MKPQWWSCTPVRERRIILEESDLWDGNTYALRSWDELPAHIQSTLDATYKRRRESGDRLSGFIGVEKQVMQGSKCVAVACSHTFAKRIARALNNLRVNERGC